MFDLGGKKALITGASGGIGGAIARALHRQGANVALSGTRREALDALAAELTDGAYAIPADLGNADEAAQLVAAAQKAMGGIDILVNNAGLTRDGLAIRIKDEDWRKVMNVNLDSAFRLTRGCLKGMMKNRWGRIICITSIVAATGNPGQANYAASKAALTAMSKSIAQEVASRGITVNCLAPGFIATAMTETLDDGQKQRLQSNIPCRRLGTVDDIANAAVYLASNEASYVTGQTLHVNGGLAMI